MELPIVTARRSLPGRLELDLVVPAAHACFRGHFPSYPILPGVVQLQWAVAYGREHFGLGDAAVVTVRVKFRRPCLPDERLLLALSLVDEHRALSFDYRGEDGLRSSGRLGFETP
jgi:3-hydroxymyristoyl/3-hydroxydecanoyl-(acyl carrier protein) dehydratase